MASMTCSSLLLFLSSTDTYYVTVVFIFRSAVFAPISAPGTPYRPRDHGLPRCRGCFFAQDFFFFVFFLGSQEGGLDKA